MHDSSSVPIPNHRGSRLWSRGGPGEALVAPRAADRPADRRRAHQEGSHALDGVEASGADGLDEGGVVALVLGGVAFAEVGDRDLECVVFAEIAGDRYRVA